ncbi:MAG: methionyl-tRNA formyltransferase [Verrucomicrobiota bacterium]|nr:methionyl-tRNA formyltransferase [Verrucomicrobiota bacterium]
MPDLPKIVYFGSDAICLPGLRYLVERGRDLCELAAVVSQPDRRKGRGKKLQKNAVAAYASTQSIQLLQPENPDFVLGEWLRAQSITLAFVMAYGHYLPKTVREAPKHGMLNFHGSVLPNYRGASPVETAIAMGDSKSGVCLMQVVKELDAGPVAECEYVSIESTDTGSTLRAKVGQAVVPLISRNLEASLRDGLEFSPQDADHATFCRKILKKDGALDFYQSAASIDARRRAFTPWPGSFFDHREMRIKIGYSSVAAMHLNRVPGTVLRVGKTLDIATSDGVLCIHELQRPTGRLMPVSDFLRGYEIVVGDVLASVPSVPLLVIRD